MTNNDKLRRLRYALDLPDREVVRLFGLAGYELAPDELAALFAKEDDPGFDLCPDELVRLFLDGLILSRRGPRPEPAVPSFRAAKRPGPLTNRDDVVKPISNNEILKAIRIALSLKDEDLIDCLAADGFPVTKAQLSALFRAPGHSNYRPCGDQFLRHFLAGLTLRLRGKN
jgi:uncharacterized protein YehS (DUF1456 family)